MFLYQFQNCEISFVCPHFHLNERLKCVKFSLHFKFSFQVLSAFLLNFMTVMLKSSYNERFSVADSVAGCAPPPYGPKFL